MNDGTMHTAVLRGGMVALALALIAFVTTENPALPHTDVWYRIRDSQPRSVVGDPTARGIVASIASYVRSIQK